MDEECHGCPDGKGAKLACLAGAQGDERAWMLGGGAVPDRADLLLGFVTLFRLPVYSPDPDS